MEIGRESRRSSGTATRVRRLVGEKSELLERRRDS